MQAIPSSKRSRQSIKSHARLWAALAAGVGLGGGFSGAMAADTWTWNGGGANANWSLGANWTHTSGSSGSTIPVNSPDTTVNFAGSSNLSPVQNITIPIEVNSLGFNSGAGSFTLGGNAVEFVTSSLSVSPTIVENSSNNEQIDVGLILGSNTTLSGSGAGALVFFGSIAGSSSITDNFSGQAALYASNNYSGGTTINSGAQIDVDNNNSFGSGAITFNGGTIATNANVTLGNTINNSGGLITFKAVAGATMTLAPGFALFGSANFGDANFNGTVSFSPSNFNTFGGQINVNGGLLFDANSVLSQVLGSYNVAIAQGATLNINGASTTIADLTGAGTLATGSTSGETFTLKAANFSGTISGSGKLITTGGTVILTGPSTFFGGANFGGGTVGAGNAFAIGGNVVTVTANTNLYAAGASESLVNPFTINSGKSLTLVDDPNGAHTLTLSASVSGSGALVMSGTSSLSLPASNGYTGGTTLNSGQLIVNNANSLGSGFLHLNGGTLTSTNTTTIPNGFSNFSATSPVTIQAAAGTTLTFGTFNSEGDFGPQDLHFGSASDTGTVDLLTGFGNNANESIFVDGGTVLDGSGTLAFILYADVLTIAKSATLNFNGESTTIGNLLGAGTLATGANTSETLTLDNANFSGTLTGSGKLITNGGTYILSGPNTYSGGSTFGGGTVGAGSNSALGGNTVTVTANTNLYAAGADQSLFNVFALNSGKTLTIQDDPNGAHNLALGANISGSGSLVMSGTGSLFLLGSSSYSGGTTLNSGQLIIINNFGLGSGFLHLNGGTLTSTSTVTLANDFSNFSATSAVTIQAATGTTLTLGTVNSEGDFGPQDLHFGSPSDTGTVDLLSGFGNNTNESIFVDGGTVLDGNGTLAFILYADDLTIAKSATLNFNGESTTIGNLLGAGTLATGGSVGQTFTLDNANFSGTITGGGQVITNGGTYILSGPNTYSGGSTFGGGTVGAGSNTALGSNTVTVTANTNLFAAAADHTLANAIAINTGQSLTIEDDPNGAHNLTLNGNISGSGSLVMSGTDALSLFGSNSFTGGTTLNSGQIIINNDNSISQLGAFTINGGTITATANATINDAYDDTAATSPVTFQAAPGTTLTLGGAAGFGPETLNFGSPSDTGIVNFSPGQISVTNSQYDINGGTLLNGDGLLPQILFAVIVDIAPSATLDLNNAGTEIGNLIGAGTLATGPTNTSQVQLDNANFSGQITGTGQLATTGNTVILSGPNTYSGGSNFGGGTVGAGSNSALGSAGITVTANTNLFAAAAAHTLVNTISINTGQILTVQDDPNGANDLRLNGSISGGGSLVMNGTATVRLIASNSYTGGTTVNSGTLAFGVAGALPTGSVLVNNGTVLVNGNNTAGNISGSGTLNVGPNVVITMTLAPSSGADTQGLVTVFSGSTLNITNNKLVINYGTAAADPITAITAALGSGYNNGLWTGKGIQSSTAALNPTKFAVGYLDGNQAIDPRAGTVTANQMIVAYTLAGDAFLEGTVGFDDLVVVAQDFGFTGKDWAGGNFNYNPFGSVGFNDLVSVAQNFGFSSGVNEGSTGGALSPAWQSSAAQLSATSVVPEPGAVAMGAILAGSLLLRRRRRHLFGVVA